MKEQEVLIAGLRTQRDQLSQMIEDLERKAILDCEDWHVYQAKTKRVERELKRIRVLAIESLVRDLGVLKYILN